MSKKIVRIVGYKKYIVGDGEVVMPTGKVVIKDIKIILLEKKKKFIFHVLDKHGKFVSEYISEAEVTSIKEVKKNK